jgi:hypothetical protein
VIEIIRTEDEPKPVMMAEFGLTDRQAEAILNMRLRSLRKLEEMELRQGAGRAAGQGAGARSCRKAARQPGRASAPGSKRDRHPVAARQIDLEPEVEIVNLLVAGRR